ncbi:MAG: sulfur carrier protein ThiS [Prevotellaceae bacterium]|jgi:sulfur carrier protein|nr:sulfur carrier protein ThiS [Prevotellaceae bacterium]
MKIYLNEKEYEVAENTMLSGLPAICALPETGIAFAIDNNVVPKKDWANTQLADGEKVIVIKAVCGG